MSDTNEDSIPVLHEILVPGSRADARQAPGGLSAEDAAVRREPSFGTEPLLAPEPLDENEPGLAQEPLRMHDSELAAEPELAPQPVLTAEQMLAPEPVIAPEPAPHPASAHAQEAAHAADPHHPKKRSRAQHAADAKQTHDDLPSAGVFDRHEPHAPLEAGATVPPDIAREEPGIPQLSLDADVIAERLRGRFAGFLTGEGRGIIEARCRDALQEHTTWLVNQITREVAMTLETEMTGWVREAVEEEIARRSGRV
ncbi:DUF2486 family protein [Paraburkholderia sp. BCC1884]|uniref:DUF2486 family protein n=1 Tax=Paraburkholderia sp. BCC1884 TaxID=2562668 RepID=UPI001183E44B|nr:DUF2486 family protein [Paraburkholderia sp. BCC1884]